MNASLKFWTLTLCIFAASDSLVAAEILYQTAITKDQSHNGPNVEIEEVYVTAQSASTDLAARNTDILDAEELFQSAAIDIPSALASLPNISTVAFGSNGKRKNIDIRGSGDTSVSNVAVLVDGQRIGVRDQGGTDFSRIPFSQISKIEVIRGSNTVRYGSGASQGIIKISRRNLENTSSLEISHQQGNFDLFQSGVFTRALLSEGNTLTHGFSVYRSRMETDGYRQHDRLNSDNLDLSYQLWDNRAITKGDQKLSADLNYSRYTDYYELPGPLSLAGIAAGDVDRRDASSGAVLGGSVNQSDLLFRLSAAPLPTVRVDLTASQIDRDDDIFTRNSISDPAEFGSLSSDTDAIRTELSLKNRYATQRLGFDYEDQSISRINELRAGSTQIDVSTRIRATYYQVTSSITDSVTATAGYRRDEMKVKQAIGLYQLALAPPEKNTWENEAFEFNGLFVAGTLGQISASAAHTFRNPNADELALPNDVIPLGPSVLKVGQLMPQNAERYELGYETPGEHWRAKIYVFRAHTSNEIIFRAGSGAGGNVNGNLAVPTKREGVEVSLAGPISDRVSLRLSGGWQQARLQDSNRIPLVPERNFTVSTVFKPVQDLEISVTHRYVGNRIDGNDFENNDENNQLDSYQILNASLVYGFQLQPKMTADVFAQLENILNERYASASYSGQGYPQPLFAVRGGLRFTFK